MEYEKSISFETEERPQAEYLNGQLQQLVRALGSKTFPKGSAYKSRLKDTGEGTWEIEVRRGTFRGVLDVGLSYDSRYVQGVGTQQFMVVGVRGDYAITVLESAETASEWTEKILEGCGFLFLGVIFTVISTVATAVLVDRIFPYLILLSFMAGGWVGKVAGEFLGGQYYEMKARRVEKDVDSDDAIADWDRFIDALDEQFGALIAAQQTG